MSVLTREECEHIRRAATVARDNSSLSLVYHGTVVDLLDTVEELRKQLFEAQLQMIRGETA